MQPSAAKGISVFLKVLAVMTFIGGFILGAVLGKDPRGDFDFALALVYWARALIYGMIVLAISAIIDLLLQIRGRIFNEREGAVVKIDGQAAGEIPAGAGAAVLSGHPPVKNGKCELCGKDNEDLYSAKIVDDLGTRYRIICKECASKPGRTLTD